LVPAYEDQVQSIRTLPWCTSSLNPSTLTQICACPVNVGCLGPQCSRSLLATSKLVLSSLLAGIIPTTNWCPALIIDFSSDNFLSVVLQTILPRPHCYFPRSPTVLPTPSSLHPLLFPGCRVLPSSRERVSDEPPGLARPPIGPPEIQQHLIRRSTSFSN
jgi:hypothetical protein